MEKRERELQFSKEKMANTTVKTDAKNSPNNGIYSINCFDSAARTILFLKNETRVILSILPGLLFNISFEEIW